MPERDILLVERYIAPRLVAARRAPRFGKEHQGQHALGFRFFGQQGDHEPAEPDGLFAKRRISVLADLRPRFGVRSIDRLEHRIETFGKLVKVWHSERDPGLPDA